MNDMDRRRSNLDSDLSGNDDDDHDGGNVSDIEGLKLAVKNPKRAKVDEGSDALALKAKKKPRPKLTEEKVNEYYMYVNIC